MKAFLAMYKLTLRAALRERVVWSMLALTGLVLVLLPPVLRGDGTLHGELRMQIRYTLGFSAALLAAMTLWMSCGTLAGDLSSKRLQMVLSKPVSRAVVWWGKWAAVTTLSVGMLMFCGAATLLHVHSRVSAADLDEAGRIALNREILTARRPTSPNPVDLSETIQAMLEEQMQLGVVPPDYPEELLLRELRNIATVLRNAANQDESILWEFDLPTPLRGAEDLQVAYRFDGASMGVTRIPGQWRVGTPETPDLYTETIHQSPSGEFVLEVNTDGRFDGAQRILVEFLNQSEQREMVFFRPDDGVTLYRPGGHFAPNVFRALLLLGGLIGLLAALGVSSGGLFSLPVACYATAVMLLLQLFSGSVEKTLEQGSTLGNREDPGLMARVVDRVSMTMYRGMHAVLKPLDVDSPLERVSRGVMVPGHEVMTIMGLRMVPLLLLISVGGIFLFQRREVGVAE